MILFVVFLGDAEMENRMNRVIRACVELGNAMIIMNHIYLYIIIISTIVTIIIISTIITIINIIIICVTSTVAIYHSYTLNSAYIINLSFVGDNNPIVSIHDQGAGGNGNVLKEIGEWIIYMHR
jgi:hypothetical protein